MTKTTSKVNKIAAVVCNTVGHDIQLTNQISTHFSEYCCKRCNAQYATNEKGQLMEMSAKLRGAYDALNSLRRRKRQGVYSVAS